MTTKEKAPNQDPELLKEQLRPEKVTDPDNIMRTSYTSVISGSEVAVSKEINDCMQVVFIVEEPDKPKVLHIHHLRLGTTTTPHGMYSGYLRLLSQELSPDAKVDIFVLTNESSPYPRAEERGSLFSEEFTNLVAVAKAILGEKKVHKIHRERITATSDTTLDIVFNGHGDYVVWRSSSMSNGAYVTQGNMFEK